MALNIGELTGFIRLDARGVDDGVQQARGAMTRLQTQMTGDGERAGAAAGQAVGDGVVRGADGAVQGARGQLSGAGDTAGQALGDGIVQGADGRLRNARGQFVAAGRRAGDAYGDGLTDGAAEGGDDAAAAAEDGLSRVQVAAAAAGVAAGAVLMEGITQALDQGVVVDRMEASMGTTPALAQKYGKVAGVLFANAITADFQTAADAVAATMNNGLLPPDATNAQIESMSTRLADLSTLLGEDVGLVGRSVGKMLKTGLAEDGAQAIDVLTRGVQLGVNEAEDLLDTFSEYSTQFRKLGIDGPMALGLLSQGLQGGARDADIVADAFKEFSIRAIDGSESTVEGFKAIGLNAEDMAAKIAAGGPSARAALDLTLDKLRGIKDPAEQSAAAVALFGTQSEDLGAALFKLDPSSATKGLGDFAGATDRAGKTLRDNASTEIEVFKRQAMQAFVNVLGTQVIPRLMQAAQWVKANQEPLKTVGLIITAIVVPALILMGVNATISAVSMVAAWVMSGAAAVGGAATHVVSAASVVGGWILMGVQSAIQAARMAAAWFIALGPVGWVIATVVGLVALIILNWDTVKAATGKAWEWVWSKIKTVAGWIWNFFLNWTIVGRVIKHWDDIKQKTSTVWNAVKDFVKGIPGKLIDFFLNWTIVGRVIKHWDDIKEGTEEKAGEMIEYVRTIPGKAVRAMGDLGSKLLSAGKSLIQGFIDGIKSKIGDVKDTLGGLTGSLTSWKGPESLDARLLTPAGRLLIRGFERGINDEVPALRQQLQGITADLPGMAAPAAGAERAALVAGNRAAALHIEHYHEAGGSPRATAEELLWLAKGRG